ncbi:MAG: hypothetical protein ACI9UV_002110 [Algoriphagus sp.]|jgi:hypothetical protein|tara:strand:- start:412 stop:642 length:231 start_codon:yes stop_codon:yes gene_type:complete
MDKHELIFFSNLKELKQPKIMEKDLINSSLHSLCIQKAKSITEVAQYLKMKYRLDIEEIVLKKRLNNIISEEKAVA